VITRVYLENDAWFVQLYNPWGVDTETGSWDGPDDGFLTLDWSEATELLEIYGRSTRN
jgi:hypothetical protein